MDDKRIRKMHRDDIVSGEEFDVELLIEQTFATAKYKHYLRSLEEVRAARRELERLQVEARAYSKGEMRVLIKTGMARLQARSADGQGDIHPTVPRLGEVLVGLFCNRTLKEAILGDLAETFEMRARERGVRNARLWYWWQVARSFVPFAWRWGRRLVELDDVRRLIGW